MRAFFRIVAALIVLGIVALLGIIFVPTVRTGPVQTASAAGQASADGAAVAVAGDCAACHTAPGGAPFAGGRKIDSPFGTIYSTNITPDKQTGIGNYTLDDFRAALYDGVRKDGAHLYPAMPYANYRKMTEADVAALYTYFTTKVRAIANTPPETRLVFPFNQRWGLRLWNWVALPKAGFEPHMGDAKLDRGAYLVEAPGHCGACHTPRNLFFAEKGYDAGSADYLTGAMLGEWPAADLRARNSATQRWSKEDLAALLRSGRNSLTAVAGEMALTVGHSLSNLPPQDIEAIVAYLKAIKQDRDSAVVSKPRTTPQPTMASLSAASSQLPLGARLYLDNCNACHFVSGKGAPDVFPQLDGNELVTASSAGGLISVILDGAEMPSTSERPERLRMPGFAWRLSDDEVAALATFIRQSWSNDAGAVTAADVKALRH